MWAGVKLVSALSGGCRAERVLAESGSPPVRPPHNVLDVQLDFHNFPLLSDLLKFSTISIVITIYIQNKTHVLRYCTTWLTLRRVFVFEILLSLDHLVIAVTEVILMIYCFISDFIDHPEVTEAYAVCVEFNFLYLGSILTISGMYVRLFSFNNKFLLSLE